MLIDFGVEDVAKMILTKKKLLSTLKNSNYKKINVALIGGYGTHELMDWLRVYCADCKLDADVESLGWGNIFQILSGVDRSKLVKYDLIVILPFHDSLSIPYSSQQIKDIERQLLTELDGFFEYCLQKNIKVIQCDFPSLPTTNNNQHEITSALCSLNQLNEKIYKLVNKFNNVNLCCISVLVDRVGSINWYDRRNWASFGDQLSALASISLGKYLGIAISSIYRPPKKVLVLDLDNTLWGGVIGDDGLDNLHIGPDSAQGRPYFEFQQYILNLKSKGVILAICSKNNPNIALEGFSLDGMRLKVEDFSSMRIGWDQKSRYISEISEELNLGLDSFVFVDDNPVERQEVRTNLREVAVPEVGDNVINFIDCLEGAGYFYTCIALTEEDQLRADSYRDNKLRDEVKVLSGNEEDFLAGLETSIFVESLKDSNVERVVQLFNKTNQFNLTTLRIGPGEIDSIVKDEILFTFKVKDRFGDYGIVSIIRLKKSENVVHIVNWVLSCRIFKRRIENAIFEWVVEYCKKNNIKIINATYIPTDKNSIVANLFHSLGFSQKGNSTSDIFEYQMELNTFNLKAQHYCRVIYES